MPIFIKPLALTFIQNETLMQKFRLWLIAFAVVMIIGDLILTDYHDLSWSNNSGSYIGILSMVCLILSMLLSNRYENKQEN
jgi:predicted ferric reductase